MRSSLTSKRNAALGDRTATQTQQAEMTNDLEFWRGVRFARDQRRSHMKKSMRTATALISGVALTIILVPPAASAKPLEVTRYHEAYSDSFSDCGFPIDVMGEASGRYMIKDSTPSTNGQFFRVLDNYSFSEVLTNRRTGEWFSISARDLPRDASEAARRRSNSHLSSQGLRGP